MLEYFIEKKKTFSKLSVGCMVAAEVSQLVFGCAYFPACTAEQVISSLPDCQKILKNTKNMLEIQQVQFQTFLRKWRE